MANPYKNQIQKKKFFFKSSKQIMKSTVCNDIASTCLYLGFYISNVATY